MTTLVYTLLQKLWRGTITSEEAKTLQEVLHTENRTLKSELQTAYEVALRNPDGTKINKNADRTWANILAQLEPETTFTKSVQWWQQRKIWWAAAAILVVVGFGTWFKTTTSLDSKTIARSSEDALRVVSNTRTDIMTLTLPDESVVRLYPKSAISYRNSFNQNERNISLKGQAVFKVFKNKQLPFVVYADDVMTTAIGTEFLVNTFRKNHVEVKLFEGKVAVRQNKPNAKDIYLAAGQMLTYSKLNNSFVLVSFQKENNTSSSRSGVPSPQVGAVSTEVSLTFNNKPLTEVFEQLSNHYKVKINYQTEQLRGLYFTGNILKKDGLPTILTLITNMNGLRYEQVGEEILITK
jgi:transmembrane sensor